MKNIVVLLFISYLFSLRSSYSQGLEFYKEDLTFEIKENIFIVKGKYYFCNTSDKAISQMLFYPFPVDSNLYGKIDTLNVHDEENPIPIIKQNATGAYFPVSILPYTAKNYIIQYQQELLGTQAEYILVSTQKWKKPLESANFTLTLPTNNTLDSLSYEVDSVHTLDHAKVYYWSRKEFMPDRNIVIIFAK